MTEGRPGQVTGTVFSQDGFTLDGIEPYGVESPWKTAAFVVSCESGDIFTSDLTSGCFGGCWELADGFNRDGLASH